MPGFKFRELGVYVDDCGDILLPGGQPGTFIADGLYCEDGGNPGTSDQSASMWEGDCYPRSFSASAEMNAAWIP